MNMGIGAMLGHLGGNAETVAAYEASLGRIMSSVEMDHDDDGALVIKFADGSCTRLWDGGRSCCEHRYITCDDDLSCMEGKPLRKIELKPGPEETRDYGEHETMFVEVTADDGTSVTLTTHNEHNGYYGGFWINMSHVAV